ncbi:MAG: hypothetical protein KME32_20380 [Mojavia pulchra JT2-VF2]|jgi:hypothetical protein|uniref:Uncharacterized protein n=1 Tax=Mojavia pulchra JT2-VF2 TaxID=287848 RepID=A0A951PZS5_9NOST|nr:hypothetical protein [Mojavia pulchra JT2-VF2]
MAENNISGNGNWYYTDGQWVSDKGEKLTLTDAFASGNPPAGYIPSNVSNNNSFASGPSFNGSANNPFAGGNPFMIGGGGNVSTTSEDGKYTYNYTRTADPRSLVPDDNSPFAKLIGVLGFGSNSSNTNSGSNPFAGGSQGNNSRPANLPSGSTPTASTDLPKAPQGLSVPYNSDNWISDLKDLESSKTGASTDGNTGSGNGNWFYGKNNTADGNGNWLFSNDNTANGNGNWFYGKNNTADGNGNWYFGIGNTTNGNGNWQTGDNNTINGNGNRPSGSGNDVLGNGNRPSGSDNKILGNAIETSDDGKAYIGNQDWNFDILNDLQSLQIGGAGIGSDVKNLLSHPDMISNTMSKEGYSNSPFLANSNYQFDFSAGI